MQKSLIIKFNKMDKVKMILGFLKGKKTYIVGTLMIILGLLTGEKEMVLEGIGFMTLRASIN